MLYDGTGAMTDKLLDKKSALEYDKIQECVVQLYSKECCPEWARNLTSGSCVDGWFTMRENFADISGKTRFCKNKNMPISLPGITIAYRAFKKRQRLLRAGHFELTKRKFWVGYSSLWCTSRPNQNFEVEMADPHPPNECRINLVTKSVPQFAYDFGSKYALDNGKRCYLWSTRAM
jgi:predicted metalloendopeptidase